MAAIFRQPLAPRTAPQLPPIIAPSALSKASILKRPRSPDIHSQNAIHDPAATKKFRTSSATTKENVDKECRRAERENLKEEFRYKYTKAFPSWTFYFDTTDAERDALVPRVLYLHGVRAISTLPRLANIRRSASPSSSLTKSPTSLRTALYRMHRSKPIKRILVD